VSGARIQVSIRPDGSVTAETIGVAGPACLDYIAVLEDLVAGTTVSSAFTADYHRTDATEQAPARVVDGSEG
jgi:hypothetical protein